MALFDEAKLPSPIQPQVINQPLYQQQVKPLMNPYQQQNKPMMNPYQQVKPLNPYQQQQPLMNPYQQQVKPMMYQQPMMYPNQKPVYQNQQPMMYNQRPMGQQFNGNMNNQQSNNFKF
jgi:hypothetical protein